MVEAGVAGDGSTMILTNGQFCSISDIRIELFSCEAYQTTALGKGSVNPCPAEKCIRSKINLGKRPILGTQANRNSASFNP